MLIWSSSEACLTILCACIPTLRPLFVRLSTSPDPQRVLRPSNFGHWRGRTQFEGMGVGVGHRIVGAEDRIGDAEDGVGDSKVQIVGYASDWYELLLPSPANVLLPDC
jgi:hypothetical protein